MRAERSLDPDQIPDTEFATSFRGFDPNGVRVFLVQISDALRAASTREADLRQQLDWATQRVAELEGEVEAAAAHAAEEGRERGREMVAEARVVRERMLKDLARRRRHARIQVEQLMAGRDRLLEAFGMMRQTIDEATKEMRIALPEARLAAEAAGRQAEPEDEEGAVVALESDIEAARIAGLPLVEAEPEPAPEPNSLLGERDLGEMPEVELGAAFEEVRILDENEDEVVDTAAQADDEPDPPSDGPDAPEPDPPSDQPEAGAAEQVDELFAKLRESRADAVAEAHEVLADTDVADDAEAEPEAQPEDDPEPEAIDDSPHLRRDAAVSDAAKALVRDLKRVVADEQNEVLDALRRRRRNQGLDVDDALGAQKQLLNRWSAAAVPALTDAATAGATFLGADGSASASDVDDVARGLAEALALPLRGRVAEALADLDNDAGEAAQSVRVTFREWKTQWVTEAAHHHALAAFCAGLYTAVDDEAPLRWLVDEGSSCADCEDNVLAGDVPRGEAFPTGHHHPPAHDGCRCLALPVDP